MWTMRSSDDVGSLQNCVLTAGGKVSQRRIRAENVERLDTHGMRGEGRYGRFVASLKLVFLAVYNIRECALLHLKRLRLREMQVLWRGSFRSIAQASVRIGISRYKALT